MLVGRAAERERLEALLQRARQGQSAVLVISGEPGIGKTALLEHAREHAEGFTVLAAQGFESETELAYSALADLLRPLLRNVESLPAGQQEALSAALGLTSPPPGGVDRFVVSTAVFNLLTGSADPLLLLVDDAHWLDRPSRDALIFAARRLSSEGLAVLLTVRAGETGGDAFAGLPTLGLEGLEPTPAAELAGSLRGETLSAAEAARLYAVTHGNPLAIRELAGTDLGAHGPVPPPVGPLIRAAFRRRLEDLPEPVRQALLVAAASSDARLDKLQQALGQMGLDLSALLEAERRGLIKIGAGSVQFAHPLIRSVAYHQADASRRRQAHRALAESLAVEHADDRAWHLALAAVRPDEAVAAELDAAAERAVQRSGHATAARLYEVAASLTPASTPRARRLLAAAANANAAGQLALALGLLEQADDADADPAVRTEVQLLRTQIAAWGASPVTAQAIAVEEADRIRRDDPDRAAALLALGTIAAVMAGTVPTAIRFSRRALELRPGLFHAEAGLAEALLLHGDYDEAMPLIEDCVARVTTDPALLSDPGAGGAPLLHFLVVLERYDDVGRMVRQGVAAARASGAAGRLPYPLAVLSEVEFRSGRFAEAYAAAAESVQLAADTGQQSESSFSLVTLARVEGVLGREAACRQHAAEARALAITQGIGSILVYHGAALGLLELGLGRLHPAIEHLDEAAAFTRLHEVREPNIVQWQPDHIEALVRTGRNEAEAALETLEHWADRAGRRWAIAAALRCRGLLAWSRSAEFEEPFQAALEMQRQGVSEFETARTELCFGEALRRSRRLAASRALLESALATFTRLGAEPWARRAHAELAAAGARDLPRPIPATRELTAQELQVALLAADGLTNREVAGRLFLSVKTVESHLTRAYSKLEVRSKTQLARRLALPG